MYFKEYCCFPLTWNFSFIIDSTVKPVMGGPFDGRILVGTSIEFIIQNLD
jgi:hypothetical protein